MNNGGPYNLNNAGMTREEWFQATNDNLTTIYLAHSKALGMLKIGAARHSAETRVRSFCCQRRLSTSPRFSDSADWALVGRFIASREVEGRVHKILTPFRHPAATPQSREWYRDCPEVRGAFSLLVAELA